MSKWTRSAVGSALLLSAALISVSACGPGGAAKAARADMPTGSGALGSGNCDPTPYVVDMDTREVGDLETKFAQGIVVVKHDCKGPLKILADCSVKGAYPGVYTYVGTSSQESSLSLKDSDEIKTHLSYGPALPASLDAEVKRGTSIDIAYQQIGTANTPKVVGKDDLVAARAKGCDGATHIIETFYLGAFLTKASTSADVAATVEVFKQGGAAKSSSSAFQEHHLGKASVCAGINQKDNTALVPDCKAPISIKLAEIEEGNPTKGVESGSRKAPPPSPRSSGGTGKTCIGNDANACATSCKNFKDAASCAIAGFLYEEGRGNVKPDLQQAFAFYKQACDGGNQDGCAGLGLLYSKGDAPGGKNLAEADKLLPIACNHGSARGCSGVGTKAMFEEHNVDKALEFLSRACRLGYPRACFYAGSEMMLTNKDPKMAFLMARRACDALDLRGCLLATVFPETAADVRPRVLAALDRLCNGKSGEDCRTLGKWYRGDYDAKSADAGKAKIYFTKGCDLKDNKSCDDLNGKGEKTASGGGGGGGGGGGSSPSSTSGFMIKNDSPWPVCQVNAGAPEKKGIAFTKQNYLAKKLEPGASAPFTSVPEGAAVLRFITCGDKSMGVVAFSAAQPITFVVQAAGGKASGGAGAVQMSPSSAFAKTPYALHK